MKYAIVESSGKQYKAVEGETISVDKLPLDVGKKMDLKEVYLVSDDRNVAVGTPKVSGAKVKATVVEQYKAPKIVVFKYKSRQRYRVKRGHRQQYTRLQIDKIESKLSKAAEAKAEKPAAKKEAKAALAKAEKPKAKKETIAAVPKKPAAKKETKAAAPKKPEAKKPTAKKPAAKKPAPKKTDKK